MDQIAVVQLEPMKQLIEAVDGEDDWTGLTDSAARRKRQNRLHQRAWRRRKAHDASNTPQEIFIADGPIRDSVSHRQTHNPKIIQINTQASSNNEPLSTGQPTFLDLLTLNDQEFFHHLLHTIDDTKPEIQNPLIAPILPYLNTTTYQHPLPQILFPLAPDHRLLTLIQYNVLRATLLNMSLLPLSPPLPTYCTAALLIPSPLPTSPFYPPSTIPPSLRPTPLQLSTPHDPWIDLIPCPQLRDNMILTGISLEQNDDLCCDLVGGLYEGFNDVENRGIIIWGEPWRVDGWEVSGGFARKWGFLLKGCVELVRSSDVYREGRGEGRLVVVN